MFIYKYVNIQDLEKFYDRTFSNDTPKIYQVMQNKIKLLFLFLLTSDEHFFHVLLLMFLFFSIMLCAIHLICVFVVCKCFFYPYK